MRNGQIAISLLIVLTFGGASSSRAGEQVTGVGRPSSAKRDAALVTVSLVLIKPERIHQTREPHRPLAIITLEIFHDIVSQPQTATLEISTFSTNPSPLTGVSASYAPASQTVIIPPGPGGIVYATAKVESADIGKNTSATVVIDAVLTHPSPGIRVVESPASDHQATLTIVRP